MKLFIRLLFLTLWLLAPKAAAENYTLSPNMSLPVPIIGVETGPNYATDINNALGLLDSHNHTFGQGVQIPSSGLNINADLTYGGNNATSLRACRYSSQTSPITATAPDLYETYVSGVDLYYNDGNGNQVRLTQSGAVAGTPGSISGLASPATASYSAGSTTFVWQSAANTPANMDFESAILRNNAANSKGLTLSPPNSMGSNFTITLPSLPASTSVLTITNAGAMNATLSPTLTTIPMTSGPTQQVYATNTLGVSNSGTDRPVVVSGGAPTNGLLIVRGGGLTTPSGASCGTPIGEGYSCTRTSTGLYAITFSVAFPDNPVCTCVDNTNSPRICSIGTGSSSLNLTLATTAGAAIDEAFSFICIGQRPAGS